MKQNKKFTTTWKSSKQPRKQRKYLFNAPLHVKHKLLAAPLVKTLQQKYKKSNVSVRTGDIVKIMRGQFKGQRGKIALVKLKRMRVAVEGVQQIKKDGSKSYYLIHPSKVMIEELNLEDKRRREKIEGAKK
jgi:large subunit ribosomal protein L24